MPGERIKRALADESVRETLPGESLQPGQRTPQDLSTSLAVDPSWKSGYLNLEVFDSLAKISDTIHDTRRNSIYQDFRVNEQEEMNDLVLGNFLKEQKTEQETTAYTADQLSNISTKWDQVKNAASLTGKYQTTALNSFMKDVDKLIQFHRDKGDFIIAANLENYKQRFYSDEYKSALTSDIKLEEDKTTKSITALGDTTANSVWLDRNMQPLDSVHAAVNNMFNISLLSSSTVTNIKDQELFQENYSKLYRASAGRILADDALDTEEKLTAFNLLIQDAAPLKTFTGVRPATKLEQQLIEQGVSPDDKDGQIKLLRNSAGEPVQDSEGRPLMQETWTATLTDDDRNYILDLMGKVDRSNELLGYELTFDHFKQSVNYNDISSGKSIFEIPYFANGSSRSRVSADCEMANNTIIKAIASSKTGSAQESWAKRRDMVYDVFARGNVTEWIQRLHTSGADEATIANVLASYATHINNRIGNKAGVQSLDNKDAHLVIETEAGAINLNLPDNMVTDPFANGSYLQKLSKELKTEAEYIKSHPGCTALLNQRVAYQKGRAMDHSSASFLLNTDAQGNTFVNPNNTQIFKNDLQNTKQQAMGVTHDTHSAIGVTKEITNRYASEYSNPSLTGAQKTRLAEAFAGAQGNDGTIVNSSYFVNESSQSKEARINAGEFFLLKNAPTHTYVKDLLVEYKSKGGDPSFLPANMGHIQNRGDVKLDGLSAGNLREDLNKMYKKCGVPHEYWDVADRLVMDIIGAKATNPSIKDKTVHRSEIEAILNGNFAATKDGKVGSFKFEPQFTLTQGDKGTFNTQEGFIANQQIFTKAMNKSSYAHGYNMKPVVGGVTILRPDGTTVSVRMADGTTKPFVIYSANPAGVDPAKAMKHKVTLASLVPTLTELSDLSKNPALKAEIAKMPGLNASVDDIQKAAIQALSTLYTPEAQAAYINYMEHPNQYGSLPQITNTKAMAILAGDGPLALRLAGGVTSFDALSSSLKGTSEEAKNRMKALNFLEGYRTNPTKINSIGRVSGGASYNIKKGSVFMKDSLGRSLIRTNSDAHHGDYAIDLAFQGNPENAHYGSFTRGVVAYVGPGTGFGNHVVAIYDKANNFMYIYGHNSRALCKVGSPVQPGTEIAVVGSEGHSTGPHIHFEGRPWPAGKPFTWATWAAQKKTNIREWPITKAATQGAAKPRDAAQESGQAVQVAKGYLNKNYHNPNLISSKGILFVSKSPVKLSKEDASLVHPGSAFDNNDVIKTTNARVSYAAFMKDKVFTGQINADTMAVIGAYDTNFAFVFTPYMNRFLPAEQKGLIYENGKKRKYTARQLMTAGKAGKLPSRAYGYWTPANEAAYASLKNKYESFK